MFLVISLAVANTLLLSLALYFLIRRGRCREGHIEKFRIVVGAVLLLAIFANVFLGITELM